MFRSILVFLGVLTVSTGAFAQAISIEATTTGATTTEATPAEATPTVATPQIADAQLSFHGQLAKGHDLYIQKNYDGAFQAYEAAKNKEPGNAMAYYFIGCAQVKLTRFDDAVVTLRAVTTMAGDKNTGVHAKALFMIAVIEETRGNMDAALQAWTAYKGYVQTRSVQGSFIGTADSRIEVIEKKRALDEKYKIVVERITAAK